MSSFGRNIAGLINDQGKLKQSKVDGIDSSEAGSVINSEVAAGVSYFDTLDSLPTTGLSAGLKALVNISSTEGKLYVYNGDGWYNSETNLNTSAPVWVTEPDASYDIADSATPLIVTALASDPDSDILINKSFVSDSAQYLVSISNDSSVWTFTPKTADQIGTEVAAGNLEDSSGDFIYTFRWNDGINVLSKAVTISYSTASGGPSATGWWNRVSLTGFPSSAGTLYPATRGIAPAPNGDIYQFCEQAADDQAFLVKYNSTGNAQWAKHVNGNAYYTRPKSVVTSSDSNSIYTVMSDYGYGENMSGNSPQLALIIKWTSAGAVSWTKIIRPITISSNYDYFTPEPGGGVLDSNGNLWVLGTNRSGSGNYRKIIIAKLNGSTGSLMGCWKLNSNNNDQASDYKLIMDTDDNLYVTGTQYVGSYPNMLIAKFDTSSMTLTWAKMYGGGGTGDYDAPWVVKVDSNNDPYIVGYTKTASTDYTGVVFKLNKSNGAWVWGKQHSDTEFNQSIAIDGSDNIFILGEDDDDTPTHVILRKYSTDGTLQNQWGIDTNVSNYRFGWAMDSLDITPDGNLLIGFHHNETSWAASQMAPIKMPGNITAGTYGNLVITNQTPVESSFNPGALTHTSYSVSSQSSSFQTVNYNSGSKAVEPIVTLTISSENLDTIP